MKTDKPIVIHGDTVHQCQRCNAELAGKDHVITYKRKGITFQDHICKKCEDLVFDIWYADLDVITTKEWSQYSYSVKIN